MRHIKYNNHSSKVIIYIIIAIIFTILSTLSAIQLNAVGCGYMPNYFNSYGWDVFCTNKLKSTPDWTPLHNPDPQNWSSDRITYSWLGHATVLLNVYGTLIVTDPVFSNRIGLPEMGRNMLGIQRITKLPLDPDQLPVLDFVLISHAHYDHLDRASYYLDAFKQWKTTFLVPWGVRPFIEQKIGWEFWEPDWVRPFFNYKPKPKPKKFYILPMDYQTKPKIKFRRKIVSFRAFRIEHYGFASGRNTLTGVSGYIITAKNKRIAFFGDTSFNQNRNAEGYILAEPIKVDWRKQVRGHLPDDVNIDLCILPIGDHIYNYNHISPEQALNIADQVGCKQILPMHYGTFILSNPAYYPKTPRSEFLQIIESQNRQDFANCTSLQDEGRVFQDIGIECVLD